MKFPSKGRIVLWTLLVIAIYVVLGFADVVPLSGGVKGAILIFGKYALWTLGILIGLLVLVVIGSMQSIDSIGHRLSVAKRAGDRKEFRHVLGSVPIDHGLKLAAEQGETDIVREMIDRGAHPDGYPAPGDHGEGDSPLMAAARSGSEEIVRILIAAGADVNRWVRLDAYDDDKACALDVAIWSDHHSRIVKLLVQHGADATRALSGAISYRRVEVLENVEFVRLLLEHGADPTPALPDAISGGHAEVVSLLLEHGADPTPALPCAISDGHLGIAKLLLQHGADATAALRVADYNGGRDFEFLSLLIEHGADPSLALSRAISHGHLELVSLLLERGAPPTPALPDAISGGHEDIVKLLLQHGADIDVLKHCNWPDAEQSALLLARIGEHRHACEIIKAAAGVELPATDETLLQRSGKVGSLFVALAERYEAEGDYVSAKRLCEWKLNRRNSLWDTSACLRILAQTEERQGNVEGALRLCRDALSRWQLDTRLEIWESLEANELLLTELRALLCDCERIFARLGKSEERDRVVVALKRLGGVES